MLVRPLAASKQGLSTLGGSRIFADHRTMAKEPPRLRAGRPPWEPLNGIRVGGFAGMLLGALLGAVTHTALLWFLVAGAVIGAAAGYFVASRGMKA